MFINKSAETSNLESFFQFTIADMNRILMMLLIMVILILVEHCSSKKFLVKSASKAKDVSNKKTKYIKHYALRIFLHCNHSDLDRDGSDYYNPCVYPPPPVTNHPVMPGPFCYSSQPCQFCTDYQGVQHKVGEYFKPHGGGLWDKVCQCLGYDCKGWSHEIFPNCQCHKRIN